MNDTPETDAALEILHTDSFEYGSGWMDTRGASEAPVDEQYIKADLARRLERERDEARREAQSQRDRADHQAGNAKKYLQDFWDMVGQRDDACAETAHLQGKMDEAQEAKP